MVNNENVLVFKLEKKIILWKSHEEDAYCPTELRISTKLLTPTEFRVNAEFSNLLNNAVPDTCRTPIYIWAFVDVLAESPIDLMGF